MEGHSFDEAVLERELGSVSPDGLLAYGLLCCERMIPNYEMFQIQSGWGDAKVLRTALDIAWTRLISGPSDDVHSELRERCEDIAPDTEDFDSVLVSSALDAAVAVGRVMDLLENRDPAIVIEIASLAIDTVDMYVQEVLDIPRGARDLEERIRTHVLMQEELKNQHADLLRVRGNFDKDSLQERYRANRRGSLTI